MICDGQDIFTQMLNGTTLQILWNIQVGMVQVRVFVQSHVDTCQVITIFNKLSKVGITQNQSCAENIICLKVVIFKRKINKLELKDIGSKPYLVGKLITKDIP
jgi:hypothetical protein